jgi:hypothetical protein
MYDTFTTLNAGGPGEEDEEPFGIPEEVQNRKLASGHTAVLYNNRGCMLNNCI